MRMFNISEDPSPVISLGVRWWYGNHDPQASENVVGGALEKYDNYVNTENGKLWLLLDPTPGNLEWIPLGNTSALLNLPRDYSAVSLAPDEQRTPNVLHDTFVSVVVAMENQLGSSTTVSAQVDCGDGFVERAKCIRQDDRVSADSLSFIVPAGGTYKLALAIAGDGSITLNSINELTL